MKPQTPRPAGDPEVTANVGCHVHSEFVDGTKKVQGGKTATRLSEVSVNVGCRLHEEFIDDAEVDTEITEPNRHP